MITVPARLSYSGFAKEVYTYISRYNNIITLCRNIRGKEKEKHCESKKHCESILIKNTEEFVCLIVNDLERDHSQDKRIRKD